MSRTRQHSVLQSLWLFTLIVSKELRLRYKGTTLGFFWSLLHPLALMLVFSVVFGSILKNRAEDFHLYLLAGLLSWQWLAGSLTAAASSVVQNAQLVRRTRFNYAFLPLAVVANHLIHFTLSLPVLIAFLLVDGREPQLIWLVGAPVLLVVQGLLVSGLSLMVAGLNVYYRDIAQLVPIALTLWFWCTPIVYEVSLLSGTAKRLVAINPATPMITAWRGLLLQGTLESSVCLLAAAWGVLFAIVGAIAFTKLEKGFGDVL